METSTYENTLPLLRKFRTDPLLIFCRSILDPDKYDENIQAPEALYLLTTKLPKSIPENWITSLNLQRDPTAPLTNIQVVYKDTFRYFLDFLKDVLDAINASYISVANCSWLVPWLTIISEGVRYKSMHQYGIRYEIAEEMKKGFKLTPRQADVYNDHGLYHHYEIFKTFIERYNPEVMGIFSIFGIKFKEVPEESWLTVVKDTPGLVKINRWEELNAIEEWVNGQREKFPVHLGIYSPVQLDAIKLSTKNNLSVFRKEFINK